MNNSNPTLQQLERALKVAEQIAALEAELASLLKAGSAVPPPAPKPTTGKHGGKRFLSAKALANIRAGQARRWAKKKAANKAAPAKAVAATPKSKAPAAKAAAPAQAAKAAPTKKRRKLSPEGRAKLAAMMKARWEAARASGGPAPTSSKA